MSDADHTLLWRITREKYQRIADAFNGNGAADYPGRWNRAGVPVVYSSCSIALSVLEILVHAKSRKAIDGRFVLFKVTAPSRLIYAPEFPGRFVKAESREFGDKWIKSGAQPILRVPSIITGEPNYVLDPNHPDFAKIKIEDPEIFRFDPRLLSP